MSNSANGSTSGKSGLVKRIKIITGVVVALTALMTAVIRFRDSIPWLTPVNSIVVTPDPLKLVIGDKIRIIATVRDANNNPLEKKVTWSSANPSVVGVDADGIVTGKAAGETTITASVEFNKAVDTVQVRHVNVATVDVFPPETTLPVKGHLKFDATPYDSQGNSLMGRSVRWSSGNPQIASVDQSSGEATGVSTGSVRITAMSESKHSSAQLTVSQAPSPPIASAKPVPLAMAPAQVKVAKGLSQEEAKKANVGAKAGQVAVAPPQAKVANVPPPQAKALTLAFAEKITIVNGLKFGSCPANVRILIKGRLIDIRSDPQQAARIPVGNAIYDLHGTVSCPRQTEGVVNGQGTISISNGKTYRCVWHRKGTKDFTITLQPQ